MGGAEGLAKIWSDGSQSVAKCSINFGKNLGFPSQSIAGLHEILIKYVVKCSVIGGRFVCFVARSSWSALLTSYVWSCNLCLFSDHENFLLTYAQHLGEHKARI